MGIFFKVVVGLLVLVVAVTTQTEGVSEVGEFVNRIHSIGGTVIFLNTKTISIEDFRYDGQGVEVYFYSYGVGIPARRGRQGTIIRLPPSLGESDGSIPNRRYNGEDITFTLPEGMDVCDIGTLTVWCDPFDAIFGFIEVPRSLFANEDPCELVGGPGSTTTLPPPEFDNCIPLHESLQLSWRVDRDNEQVRFRLCGCQAQEFGLNQYMGFGLSGSNTQTLMFGADPTITWVDSETGQANAVDYHLSAYTQCRAGVGACPDTMDSRGTCTNDVSDVTGSASEARQCVSFTKPFSTSDSTCDLAIDPNNEEQFIVWGVGPLGETAFRHFLRATRTDAPIHLGRSPRDDCGGVQVACRRDCQPFENEVIIANENSPLQLRIGPSGNERGYMGITGRPGWGIAWYINGTLIPELVVERGKTYTFLIEGGDNPGDLSNYHPFYITDSIAGGRLQNTQEVQENETVYAGFDNKGVEIGVGELCSYTETQMSADLRERCADFNTYASSLVLSGSCSNGSGRPGRLLWTPDANTPDIVYYQCATHLNLGWKITVMGTAGTVPPPTTDEETTPTEVPTTAEPTVAASSTMATTDATTTTEPTGLICNKYSQECTGDDCDQLERCDAIDEGSDSIQSCQTIYFLNDGGNFEIQLSSCFATSTTGNETTCNQDECVLKQLIPTNDRVFFCCCTSSLCNANIVFPEVDNVTTPTAPSTQSSTAAATTASTTESDTTTVETTESTTEEIGTTQSTTEEIGTTQSTTEEIDTTQSTTEEIVTTQSTTEELTTVEITEVPDSTTPEIITTQSTMIEPSTESTTQETTEPTTTEPSTPLTVPTNVQAFCSVVVWEHSQTEKLVGYDVRLLATGLRVTVRRVRSSRTFYVLTDNDSEYTTTVNSLVQVRAWYSAGFGAWSQPISLGCTDAPQPSTCPPCECDASTTSSTLQRPGLYLKGQLFANNSDVQISEIGDGEDALICTTNRQECCGTKPNRRGQFYYPNGVPVPIQSRSIGQGFYRNRGDQLIRLNHREGFNSPLGKYCCEIPDANDVKQIMCATLI